MTNAERQAMHRRRVMEELAWYRKKYGDWPGSKSEPVTPKIKKVVMPEPVAPKKSGKKYFWGGKFRDTSDGMPDGMEDWQWEKILIEG